MKMAHVDPIFWKGKKVFLTGHTGFKGSWLSFWLVTMGAKVTGYALLPNTNPNLFNVLSIDSLVKKSHIADIRDLVSLQKVMSETKPDVVIHMAAQPFVRYSYAHPVETYSINVMGTVHVLEATRSIDSVRATVVVTTDKCYENKEWIWGYRENESMGGYDPYSNSKGCAELVTSAYRQSYFSESNSDNKVASARAGNVIGGGDWSEDRLIPDAIKAFEANLPLVIRNPLATRPWQHVLEPLSGYLVLAQALYEKGLSFASSWNFGPLDKDNRPVQEVVDLLISSWGPNARWEKEGSEQPHEANLLKLDCSKARTQLGWIPKWDLEKATKKTIEWQQAFQARENMQDISLAQIYQYMSS
jgi:CDP-glucose 4,6-dehydratase